MNGKNLNLKAKSDLLMVGDDYKNTILLGKKISLGRSDDYTFVLPPQWEFQFYKDIIFIYRGPMCFTMEGLTTVVL